MGRRGLAERKEEREGGRTRLVLMMRCPANS